MYLKIVFIYGCVLLLLKGYEVDTLFKHVIPDKLNLCSQIINTYIWLQN